MHLYQGVSDIPNCVNPKDFTCRLMKTMVRHGVYTDYIQNRVIQAQYYRDPFNVKGKMIKMGSEKPTDIVYLEKNKFLPYVNNEIQHKDNEKYKNNLSSLDKFVMIQFSEDVMIKPAATAVSIYIYMYALSDRKIYNSPSLPPQVVFSRE